MAPIKNRTPFREFVAPSADVKSAQARLSLWVRALPVRSELHLLRKAWHALMGLLIVGLYMGGMPQSTACTILGALFAWSVTMETLRLRNPSLNEKCIRFFGPIIRSNEVNRVSGMPFYLASSLIAIAVFPPTVANLAILFLALGDPIASLFGILYSHKSVKIFHGKSLHGTAAAFVVCALATWIYLRSTGMHGLNQVRLSLLGGFAGAIAELLPMELDDNFTIPMISGFILWLGFIAINFV